MHFKALLFLTLLSVFFLSACDTKRIADPHATIPGSAAKEESVAPVAIEIKEFSEGELQINELIDKKDPASLTAALERLETELFGEKSKDPAAYVQPTFIHHIELYVKLFQTWKESGNDSAFSTKFKTSLENFKKIFFSHCYDSNLKECNVIKDMFSQVKASIALVIYYSEQESETKRELRWLTMAYDIQTENAEETLDVKYSLAVLKMMQDSSIAPAEKSSTHFRQHIANIVNKGKLINWRRTSPSKLEVFSIVEAWKAYGSSVPSALKELRVMLFPYLPAYYRADAKTRAAVDTHTKTVLDEKIAGKPDLSTYPAYNNVNLSSLKSTSYPLAVLMMINLYEGSIDVPAATEFTKGIPDKSAFIDVAFTAVKTLTRWDIAQTSIYSAHKLSTFFNSKTVKSQEFFQETLNEGQKLFSLWSIIHQSKAPRVASYLNVHAEYSETFTAEQANEFFSALKRNILKTSVYPNMLALLYNLAKVEWMITLRTSWLSKTYDTTKLMMFMLTGQMQIPWFNFTNLSDVIDDAVYKESLFGLETLDAIHYFFTTKTHLQYGIDPEDFLKTLGENLFNSQFARMEFLIEGQKENYYNGGSPLLNFENWCHQIKDKQPGEETLPFYKLNRDITPTQYFLKWGKLGNSNSLFTNKEIDIMYMDGLTAQKSKESQNSSYVTSRTVNDQYKLEFLPALNYFTQIMDLVTRLKTSNASLFGNISLAEPQKVLDRAVRFKKVYWGPQLTLHKRIGDCIFIGLAESRRRVVAVTNYEKKYLSQVIYPLMSKVRNKTITEAQANAVIARFHGVSQHLDWIKSAGPDLIQYNYSSLNFMLRVRAYLTEGFKNLDPNPGNPGPSLLGPIVGSHLVIPLPANYLTDPNNDFLKNAGNVVLDNTYANVGAIPFQQTLKASSTTTAKQFAQMGIRFVTDSLSEDDTATRLTRWDFHDAAFLVGMLSARLEFVSQLISLGKIDYVDYDRAECRDLEKDLKPDCYKVYEGTLTEAAKDMNQIFKGMELTPGRKSYMELINGNSFHNADYMDLILKLSVDDFDDANPRGLIYRRITGLFDYVFNFLSKDYLGTSYQSPYDALVSKFPAAGCGQARDGCFWPVPKQHAVEAFHARIRRPGLLFPFDIEIVKENYVFVRDRVKRKMQLFIDIEKDGAAIMADVRKGENPYYFYHMKKDPELLLHLSPEFNGTQSTWNKFFKEETASFYLTEPDWSKYIRAD